MTAPDGAPAPADGAEVAPTASEAPIRPPDEVWTEAFEAELATLTGRSDLDWIERGRTLAALEARFLERGLAEAGAIGDALARRLSADLVRWDERLASLSLRGAHELAHRPVEQLERARHAHWLAESADALRSGSVLELAQAIRRAPDSCDPVAGERRLDHERESRERLLELRARLAADRRFSELPSAQLAAWTAAELDHAAETLTAIDELPPDHAIDYLRRGEDRLAWFVSSGLELDAAARLRLRMRLRRLRAEMQERALQRRLEARFGLRAVAISERVIFVLILAVLGILAYETFGEVSAVWRHRLVWVDTFACALFLTEFFTKLALVQGRARWFLRHLFIDLIPSIPFGLLHVYGPANPAEAGRLGRLLRLSRIARYVRPLMPFIRLMRALGFMARGTDRIVRRHRGALNRDLVLVPNRDERHRARMRDAGLPARLERLRARLEREWREGLGRAPRDARETFARLRSEHLESLVARHADRLLDSQLSSGETQEQTVGETLDRLAASSAEDVVANLGPTVTRRLSRGLKLMAASPLRWLPILRVLLPREHKEEDDGGYVALCLRRLAAELKRHHARLYWFTDLHGTITPSELVDRTGSALVKSSIRPASRLLLFGGAYVLVMGLLQLVDVEALQGLRTMLERFVGATLVVLGSVCLAILGVGFWLKRLAQDATSFFEKAGSAQFLGLTEVIRSRSSRRDVEILARRVLDPELVLLHQPARGGDRADATRPAPTPWRARDARLALQGRIDAWLTAGQPRRADEVHWPAIDRIALLYRDSLNGSLFGESDTRTTTQLLGNPWLQQMRERSRRIDRREEKELDKLDLETHTALKGPYLWFSLLSRSMARSAARLIVEYNRNALTLAELEHAEPTELERFRAWIRNHPAHAGPGPAVREHEASDATSYHGAEFHALHFLDDDPVRDADVEERYGAEVLALLRHDRAQLFCRVFGTYPLHLRPRSERTINLNRLYDEWIRGGRVFFLPLRLAALGLVFSGRFAGLVVRAAREIRDPRLRTRVDPRLGAEFDSAVRKIDRLRGPVVRASLWLRARFDVEYLGLSIPGNGAPPLAPEVGVDGDLAFLADDPRLSRRVDEEKRRARGDMERLRVLFSDGLLEEAALRIGLEPSELGPEHRRAVALAYRADYEGLRARLSADAILAEVLGHAEERVAPPLRTRVPRRTKAAFLRWCAGHGVDEGPAREAAWRLVRADVDGVRACLTDWAGRREGSREEAIEALAEVLRHPARISDQLVTLRSIQTLALIDVLIYREHVWRLGCYQECGDRADQRLELVGERGREHDPATEAIGTDG